ncbi:MAG: hypothetical protein J6330_04945 [Clostridia bacterium]|nr:hypothetical protein [Clostridia bacterium]
MSEKQEYFAAANTGAGFVNCFDRFFDPDKLDRLYIIKGGPGTGKSATMKTVADEAERRGYEVVRCLCSSDPRSLDGVLIPALGVGAVDGTAPHATDPKYPGAVDVVLDFYPYFDVSYLRAEREKLLPLFARCSALHKSSGKYRGFAALAKAEEISVVSSCVDAVKLRAAAARAVSVLKGKPGAPLHRQISAFSSRGKVTLDTYARLCKKKVAVCDEHGSAYIFMNALKEKLTERGIGFYYSCDTLLFGNCDAIFVPEDGTCFTVTGRAADTDRSGYDRLLNMKRFIRADAERAVRGRLRMCEKAVRTLDGEAEKLIKEAGEVHDAIEAVYKNAVDFDGVGRLRQKLIGEIFG